MEDSLFLAVSESWGQGAVEREWTEGSPNHNERGAERMAAAGMDGRRPHGPDRVLELPDQCLVNKLGPGVRVVRGRQRLGQWPGN